MGAGESFLRSRRVRVPTRHDERAWIESAQMSEVTEQESGGADGGVPIRELVDVVVKRLWVSVLVFALVMGAAYVYMDRQPVEYQAVAQLIIETDTPQILGGVEPVEQLGSSYWAIRDYLSTQYRILGSRSLANEVAERLALDTDLAFLRLDGIDDPEALRAALESVHAGARVHQAVSIQPVQDSQVVRIVAITPTAESAQAISNMVAEVYIQRNQERRTESIEGAATWLERQVETMGDELNEAEVALVRYRQDNGILAVTLQDNLSLLARMQALSGQLAEARRETDRLRTTVAQIARVREEGDVVNASISAVVDNALIQSLKNQIVNIQVQRVSLSAHYLDGHPEMRALAEQEALIQRRLEREANTILMSYQDRYETALDLETRLARRLAETEREVQALGTHEVLYNRMLREAEATRDLYTMAERRLKEVEIARNSQHNNVHLLEPAPLPRSPYAPGRSSTGMIAIALALLLALAAPFGLEALDNTIKSKEFLERKYGLVFIGMVPRIKPTLTAQASPRGPMRGQAWSADRYVHEFPKSNVAESCRSVRTNLMFLGTERPLNRLLITSAGPREGKTTTTSNIGIVMAQSGARVLLVDTDMRRPRLHKAFDISPRVGLSSLLLGEADAETAIVETEVPNLHILPSGPVPPNPTELMHTERFKEVLADLSARYDRVIFDSPPVVPVTDATVLSAFVDGVLLVVQAGGTRKELLGRALEQLRGVQANIVGVVLNDVDITKRNSSYYYGYYYYRQQDDYYGEPEEDPAEMEA